MPRNIVTESTPSQPMTMRALCASGGLNAGTPVAILDKLNGEVVKMIADPAVKEKFDSLAFVSAVGTRAEFAAFIKAEIAKWSKVAKDAGVRAD